MKNTIKTLGVIACLAACGAVFAAQPKAPAKTPAKAPAKAPTEKQLLTQVDAIVKDWKPCAKAKTGRILLYSKCFGFNHREGRHFGDYAFKVAGERKGTWTTVADTNILHLADAKYLAGFDAIVLNNSTGLHEKFAPGMTQALTDYVNRGGGVAIIHAGLDSFNDTEALQKLFGGFFTGHPWHASGTWLIRNEQPDHWLNKPFAAEGKNLRKKDELYMFLKSYDRSTCKVLLSVDLSDAGTKQAEENWAKRCGPNSIRADHDYALAWVKTVGKGRIFYTSFGHDKGAFLDAQRLNHMLYGVQYALGEK